LIFTSGSGIRNAREYISSGKLYSAGSRISVFICLIGEQDDRISSIKEIPIATCLFISITQITKNPGTGQAIFIPGSDSLYFLIQTF
jgi:hypothetical protein